MHEMSIASSIIDIIKEELIDNKQSVKEVHLKIGVLQQIVPDSLTFYYDILKKDHDFLKDSSLIIDKVMIKGKCKKCNEEYDIENLFFVCSKCNAGLEILSGNEIYIDKIVI